MTVQEFIELNPRDYGIGVALVLYSGSADPYTMAGLNLPYFTKTGVDLRYYFGELTDIRIAFDGDIQSYEILNKTRKDEYYYLEISGPVVSEIPTETTVGLYPIKEDNEVLLVPFVDIAFRTGEKNPLIGNAKQHVTSTRAQLVDRNSTQINPINLQAILSSSATPAEIPDSYYSSIGIKRSRYEGTKLTSGSLPGDDPALNFRSFKGSVHLLDADSDLLSTGGVPKVEQLIYFSLPKTVYADSIVAAYTGSFPSESLYLYREEGNNLVRIVNSKVLGSENNTVYILDQKGMISGSV